MANFLERYRNGERTEVWAELLTYGEKVRQEPLLSDAYAVALETMGRAKNNIEILASRLLAIGYRFGIYPDVTVLKHYPGPLVPPSIDVAQRIQQFEEELGLLPLSLRAFWEIVGSVNFIGFRPSWPEYSDPL